MASEAAVAAPRDERAGTADLAQTARRRTQLALATMLVLLVALAGIAVVATTTLYRTSEDRYIKEAFPLRGLSRDVLLQMLNEETAVRGYLLTGNRANLGPYEQARPLVTNDLARLDRLTQRRPDIAPQVAELRRLVPQLEAYYRRQIALVASGPAGQERAQSDVLGATARFDRFRAVAGALLDRSQEIVRSAERSQRRTFWSTLALVITMGITATGIGLALLVVLPKRMGLLYRREQDARRAAERGDRASRALTHVDDAVVLLDPDDAVRYWNPAAVTAFGVAEQHALGHPVRDVLPEVEAIGDALARHGQGAAIDVVRDGSARSLRVSETRFPEGRVLVLRDVTAEQQLDRARSEFLATASHELRTPLTAVYGAVRTLRRFDATEEPELTDRLLTMIEQESERLTAIVEQILVSAQLDRHSLHLERQPCDVSELCESIIASARLRAGGHLLSLEAPPHVVVECDPARLRQVLVNLVENALKYSPRDSRVELRVRKREASVEIEVEDHGMGISTEAQARIFEKFFRADPDMLGGVGGSGLGLYISRELIEQMGGSIAVRSHPGEGSTFTITLRR